MRKKVTPKDGEPLEVEARYKKETDRFFRFELRHTEDNRRKYLLGEKLARA